MRTFKAQKLFNGYVSVRSDIINSCLNNNEFLKITYKNKEMLLSPYDLHDKKHQFVKKQFTSKFGGFYELFDYKWNAVDKSQMVFQPFDHLTSKQ
jgi:hypothetical protein